VRSWRIAVLSLPVLALWVATSHAGLFDSPEIRVEPSPKEVRSLPLSSAEKPLDFDVSPSGAEVALLAPDPGGGNRVRFWRLDGSQPSPNWAVPRGLTPRSIVWHPLGDRFFLAGAFGTQHVIQRVSLVGGSWQGKEIYRTGREIRRLVVGPRPFEVASGVRQEETAERYRLFFGLKSNDGSYTIHSITEEGTREYQVIGPKSGFTRLADTEVQPSEIAHRWALPLGFHPAGHLLLWEDDQHQFQVARYDRDHWAESTKLFDGNVRGGTVTATPNGLGLLHWQPERDGVTLVYDHGRTKNPQANGYRFLFTPSSVPDGRGVVGLIRQESGHALVYVPIHMPLADVANAWMFVESSGDGDLLSNHGGLLRDLKQEQLHSLYDSEAYYCGGYDQGTPTRPYLVTTDIFWELLAAAYEGLFIVTERYQAIPAFWDLVGGLDQHFRANQPESPWTKVFATLVNIHTMQAQTQKDEELQLILKAQGHGKSPLFGVDLDYGELLPRGHYTADADLQLYFKAFKYLTELAPEVTSPETLQNLSPELRQKALAWIGPYLHFIAPPRAPLIWGNGDGAQPVYARHPLKEARLFPLSWGFDNEVLLSTVFHPDWPEAEQIQGTSGPRLTASTLDVAAALGSQFALSLLKDDLGRYPPLRPVLEELAQRFSAWGGRGAPQNLYDRWISALAVQWAEGAASPNGTLDEPLWRAKRLQTGLASWATLRHATVLVNERTAAECGEGGFEPIILRPPRGYVEPDPKTFEAVASMFDALQAYVTASGEHLQSGRSMPGAEDNEEQRDNDQGGGLQSLRDGILRRLSATAEEARRFKAMAEKEVRGEALSSQDYEEILQVGRVAEHHFLVFKSLANKELALSNPDPMAKIADVAGGGPLGLPFLMAAVGNPMEWDHVVPHFGRRQAVKGGVYSYYEFISERLLDDAAWREMLPGQSHPAWIAPFLSREKLSCPARYPY
jgi:hypothetical protein